MKIAWDLSPEAQHRLYIFTAMKIRQRVFQDRNAILLPHEKGNFWYFPDYGFFDNEEFKKILSQNRFETAIYSEGIYKLSSDSMLNKVISEKFSIYVVSKEILEMKSNFEATFPDFWNLLTCIFPIASSVSKIVIIPSKFGTCGSLMIDKEGQKYTLEIYVRIQFPMENIFQTIILAIAHLCNPANDLNLTEWRDRQIITEFTWKWTSLSKYMPRSKVQSTLEYLKENNGEIAKQSLDYYAKMGYPVESKFDLNGGLITYNRKPIGNLQKKEFQILNYFIRKSGRVVSYENLAEEYWGKQWAQKFSLYTLSKIVQKIRDKLEAAGIPRNIITTYKKRGYLLYN